MTGFWPKLRLLLLAAAGAAYVAVGYIASSSRHPPLFAVGIGAIPLLAGVIAVCWRSSFRVPAIVGIVALVAAVAWNIHDLLQHAAWLYFVQHAGTMAALGIMFGGTLRTHEGALCSRIALVASPEPLDAAYLRYTWQVTLAWTVYFFCSAAVSGALFAWATLQQWSFFAAVITPITLVIMFGGEYLIRLRVLPGRAHFSIAQTIKHYRRYTERRDCAE